MTAAGWRAAALAVVAVVGLASGCSGDDTSRSTDVSTAADPVGSIDTDAILASSVGIQVAGCGSRNRHGAGTVIDDTGLVVTAAHVVAGAATVTVIDSEGTEHPADVVFFDPAQDVAALLAHGDVGPPAELLTTTPEAGDFGAIVVDHPDGTDDPASVSAPNDAVAVEIVRTVRIRTTDIYHDADVERPGFEIDATVEPGDSGAMVHLADGGAGIVWARSTAHHDRAWAVALPHALTDAESRTTLSTPVDPGHCPR